MAQRGRADRSAFSGEVKQDSGATDDGIHRNCSRVLPVICDMGRPWGWLREQSRFDLKFVQALCNSLDRVKI